MGGVNLEVVRQEGLKDCGVCSLLSVIRYYGGDVSLEYLRELTSTTKNGVSAYNLVQAATILGFNSYGINSTLNDLDITALPIISHVIINKSYQHFIVIYEINVNKKELLIMDPAIGKRKISYAEFNLITSNNYIYLKPIKKILKLEKKDIVNDWLIKFLQKNKKDIPYIILLTIIYFFTNIVTVFYFKLILNKAINYNIISNVYIISKFMIVFYLFKEITSYLKSITLVKWSELLDETLTKNVLKRLMFLPYLYYKNRTTGEVISRIKDLAIIKDFLADFFSTFIINSILLLILILLILNINKQLAIYVIILSIILLLLEIFFEKYFIYIKNAYLTTEDKINSILFETINSMNTIKSLHIEKQKTNSFLKQYQILLDKAYKLNSVIFTDDFFVNVVTDIFNIFFLTVSSCLIIKNKLSLGNLIVFQTIFNYYISSYKSLLTLYKKYHNYKLAKSRIEDLFTINVENFNCLEYFQDYKLNGTIKIKNLTYSYGYKKIFNKMSLTINKKDKIFLTGESGIGKSTLMKILNRYLNIEYGFISINNIDLTHYHLDVIRRKITYISQQESLFTGTIKENIIFEESDNSNKLSKISKIVYLDEILDKELGFSKLIEEGGANFSGGERQRIILARALFKDSDIYIFDEALNQIDIEKEQVILENILKYLKDKIVIIISHRLTCQDLFNRILVLKNGKIYEKI